MTREVRSGQHFHALVGKGVALYRSGVRYVVYAYGLEKEDGTLPGIDRQPSPRGRTLPLPARMRANERPLSSESMSCETELICQRTPAAQCTLFGV